MDTSEALTILDNASFNLEGAGLYVQAARVAEVAKWIEEYNEVGNETS